MGSFYIAVLLLLFVSCSESQEYQPAEQTTLQNTVADYAVMVEQAKSFDRNTISIGQIVQRYSDAEFEIDPIASTSYVVEKRDLCEGVGANFLINRGSEESITPPVTETVYISTSNRQGISFLSLGRVLQERSSAKTGSN